uniref:Uncharacterized protein n=1 Tax=Triticum urartu TaxID=4572 RepID=A0A8R7TST0_TRIUA
KEPTCSEFASDLGSENERARQYWIRCKQRRTNLEVAELLLTASRGAVASCCCTGCRAVGAARHLFLSRCES